MTSLFSSRRVETFCSLVEVSFFVSCAAHATAARIHDVGLLREHGITKLLRPIELLAHHGITFGVAVSSFTLLSQPFFSIAFVSASPFRFLLP
jgi:hypothetical protein